MTKPPTPNRGKRLTRACQGSDGFTLIEVVVTIALVAALSMIMVAMVTQFRSIIAARERNDARVEVEALAGFVADTIRGARALPLSRDNPQQRLILSGQFDKLTFVAAGRVGSRNFGLRDVSIYAEPSPGGGEQEKLMQSLQLRRADNQVQPEIVDLALIDELRFRYWKHYDDRQDPQQTFQGEWGDTWAEPGELPKFVGFSISITRSGHKVSAERIVYVLAKQN